MRHSSFHVPLTLTMVMLFAAFPAAAAQNSGAVEQTIPPPVSQNPSVPPLHLSDDQRNKIRQTLSATNSEVDFALKSAKPSQNFQPSIGAKTPKGLHPHTLPPPLTYEIPLLKRYTYLKFKRQVLIINPLNRKIVDMFPETNG